MRYIGIYILAAIITIFNAITVNAENVIVYNNTNDLLLIGKYVEYYEDVDSKLTIYDIQDKETQKKFKKYHNDVFATPPTNSSYWFKFTVINNSESELWFESGGSYSAWYIDFYRSDSEGFYSVPIQSGALRGELSKEHNSNFYWFKLSDKKEITPNTFYVRIKSGVSAELPFYIGSLEALHQQENKILLITYIFIGAMLIMFLYNLFLYFATRDNIYLSYVFLVLMNTLCYTFNNNFSFFGDNDWWWHKHIVWQYIGDMATTVFIIHFLSLKRTFPLSLKVYIVLIAIVGVFAVLNLLGVETVKLIGLSMPFTLLLILNTIFTSIYLIIKKQKNAKIFLISWSFMLLSLASFILVINGILPYNTFTRYMVYFGILTETMLFSLALANRLNIMRNEKEVVLKENVLLVKNQNLILEQQVSERTEKLATKNQQLNIALEDVNLQKEQIKSQNEKLTELSNYKEELTNMIVHDLKNPLNVIINLAQNKVVLQAGKNMLNLIENILDVYKYTEAQMILTYGNHLLFEIVDVAIGDVIIIAKEKNIEIINNVESSTVVNIDKDIIVRVIVNILNNAIKFTHPNGKITIASEILQNNQIKTLITDTGGGILPEKISTIFNKFDQAEERKSGVASSTGLGLAFCKNAVEAHKGNIDVISEYGVGSTFWFTVPKATALVGTFSKEDKCQQVLIFSEEEKKCLNNILSQLSKLELYEAGKIIKIISNIDLLKHPNLSGYIDLLKNAVYSGNDHAYKKLLKID